MKKRRAYFIDASYIVKNNLTYISLLLKGKDVVRLYYQYDPYFLVDAPKDRKEELLAIKATTKRGHVVSPIRVEEVERKVEMKKKKMLKVYCKEPSDVPAIKHQVPYPCYEFSIPFARRFMFDMQLSPFYVITYEREGKLIKKIKSVEEPEDPPKLETMAFDIETYNPMGIPREEKDPITMISYCGKKRGVLTFKKSKKKFVETLEGEKEIIEKFNQIIKEENPDVLFGYNSANFDLPYLVTRAKKLKATFRLGRFRGTMRTLKKGLINGYDIDGRVHFDLYPMMRLFGFIGLIKAQKFTLDSVAEEVLGKKKIDVKKDQIWQLWDEGDIDKLCEYSMVDAELTSELGENFLPLEMEMASTAKMPLFQTTLSTSGQLVENLLMYHAAERGEIIPLRPVGEAIYERINAPIQGAFVKLPEPGIYENLAVLDFRGLYPSIIVSYNIDPETLLKDEESKQTFVSPTGARFSKKEIGLVPRVLDYLIDMRIKIKKQLKKIDKSSPAYVKMNARSHALKILSNSFYGYLGYARSRWYSRPCAESVTAWGRKHITETIEKAEKAGFQVLYADTDSVFLIYKNKKEVLEFMDDVNATLPEKMELELEGFYKRGVFVSKKGKEGKGAKKKYAMIGEDDRIKIRGFELVRRDWSEIAKETQLKVLEAILKEGSKEKAVKIVRDTITKLQEGKVPLKKLAINTQLNKDPRRYELASPELSAANKMLKAGMPVEKGSIISFVIGKKGKTISEKAEPLELAKDYDTDYYINNQILPSVMKILKELGYDEHSMKVGGKQKSLDSFFD
ncbi:DNA-directed DNA polymerase [Candidatus Micrarchaeota archaeon]|nr:DNA-directed DNA polymerase [Candidatus Micrarchaeota archaeon]